MTDMSAAATAIKLRTSLFLEKSVVGFIRCSDPKALGARTKNIITQAARSQTWRRATIAGINNEGRLTAE
jgi:hypothetical protein